MSPDLAMEVVQRFPERRRIAVRWSEMRDLRPGPSGGFRFQDFGGRFRAVGLKCSRFGSSGGVR